MVKVELEIKNCRDCPFFENERYYTEDSWETAFNWFCLKESPRKKIAEYVEWHEESKVNIPEWCEFKK